MSLSVLYVCNIIIKGLIWKKTDYFLLKKLIHTKIILSINIICVPTFFLIASYQILKNYAILINHELLFQRKDSIQLHRFQFLKINSLMAEIIKNQFSKTKVL